MSYAPAWVTRIDVAVDAECEPSDGKLLLDALEATRLPQGWRTTSSGVPRSRVYFRARGTEKVCARAYCRNLKTKSGEAYGRIRLEAEQRFDPKVCPLESAVDPAFSATVWKGRYGGLASKVTRLAREVQTVKIAERVAHSEITYAQGERLAMFLDLERLGLAQSYYPKSVYAARKREAAKLGYCANDSSADSPALELDLTDLIAPYLRIAGGEAG